MGESEDPVKAYTPAQIADHLMKIAPNVQDCMLVALTKKGEMVMMRTPMRFAFQAMAAAVVNVDTHSATEMAMGRVVLPSQGRQN